MLRRLLLQPSPFGLLVAFLRAYLWVLATVWLGLLTLLRLLRLLIILPGARRQILRCSRGHATPAYGVYECSCGAPHEGWAFGRCHVCGQSAGWTPCLECQLPVINPLRGKGVFP